MGGGGEWGYVAARVWTWVGGRSEAAYVYARSESALYLLIMNKLRMVDRMHDTLS
jgi:hypothetical protein